MGICYHQMDEVIKTSTQNACFHETSIIHANIQSKSDIYIYIEIDLDESIFLDVLHFPMKNIKSRDQNGNAYGRGGVITSQ